eukprot:7428067-Pyramimonas_sp.AAC.1
MQLGPRFLARVIVYSRTLHSAEAANRNTAVAQRGVLARSAKRLRSLTLYGLTRALLSANDNEHGRWWKAGEPLASEARPKIKWAHSALVTQSQQFPVTEVHHEHGLVREAEISPENTVASRGGCRSNVRERESVWMLERVDHVE